MGSSAEELAVIARDFSLGGGDIVKDDHGLIDESFEHFQERITLCQEAVKNANQKTGRRTLYFPNIVAPFDQIERYIEAALRQGEAFVSNSMSTNSDGANTADTSCASGLCDCDNRDLSIGGTGLSVNGCPAEYWTDGTVDAWNAAHKTYTPPAGVTLPANTQAKFIIEYMGRIRRMKPEVENSVAPACFFDENHCLV